LRQTSAPVISNQELMPGVYLMWLKSPQITAEAKPGQFVMLRCGEGFKYLLRRPLSIHQLESESRPTRLAFLYTVVGKGTKWLAERQAGDSLDLLGPLGKGFAIHPTSKKLLLVAGGIGIAPIAFLAQQAVKGGFELKLLLGAKTARQLYPRKLLPPETEPAVSTEDGSAGSKGMLTDLLPDFIPWADQIFACGPTSMYRTISSSNQKLPSEKPVQISLEVRMGCGLGICYACTIKTKNGLKQVCQDGPVFNLNDIIWDELSYNP